MTSSGARAPSGTSRLEERRTHRVGCSGVFGRGQILRLVRAKGGDLDDLVVEIDVGQAEAPSDDAAVAEELSDFVGARGGGDVEILGRPLQQQVAHPSADDVGRMAEPAQPLEDLGGLGVDQIEGDGAGNVMAWRGERSRTVVGAESTASAL